MKHKTIATFVVATTVLVGGAAALAACGVGDTTQRRDGNLPDGTPYHIAVPANWTGIAVSDLDAARDAGSLKERAFLEEGYAVIGTGRHPMREEKHDPAAELSNLAAVIDMFEAEFGDATWTIQTGCSGGGFSTLGMAELYPDKIDGAVAFNARGLGGIVVANMWLDLPFALKALLAPESDLPVAPIPIDEREDAVRAWEPVLAEAEKTPEGRAKIALAVTLAQWPIWSSSSGLIQASAPDPDDLDSLARSFYRSATDGVESAIGRRALYDNPAGLASWNTGVDYAEFYDNADPQQREIVDALYEAAGYDAAEEVQSDLEAINAQPRVEPDDAGVEYRLQPGRRLTGDIQVPTLQIHGVADALLPPALMSGYATAVEDAGKGEYYRQAFIETAGHCTENMIERITAVDAMVQRLETGSWGDVSPAALNATGQEYGFWLVAPRFVDYDLPAVLNRAAIPADASEIGAVAIP